jgi:putative transposase
MKGNEIIDYLRFHDLLLFGLLWLCMIVDWLWPRRQAATVPARRQPVKRSMRRSQDPKLFPGLTTKPSGVACGQPQEHADSLPEASPLMVAMCGGPREVDTQQQCCPHATCSYYGWVGLRNIRANGHPSGGRSRQLHCLRCQGFFWRRMARRCMASMSRPSDSYGPCVPWLKGWASVRWPASLRRTPIRCCRGWLKRPPTRRHCHSIPCVLCSRAWREGCCQDAHPLIDDVGIRRHSVPETITIDGSEADAAAIQRYNDAYSTAIAVRRITRPMLGFKSIEAAQSTVAGVELMHMLKKGPLVVGEKAKDLTPAEQFHWSAPL